MTEQIIEKLRELGYETLPEDHFRAVELWRQWYAGHVKAFHDNFVFNGVNKVPCQKFTTGLAKQVCEEWANRIANEELAVTLEGEKEQAFFDEVCEKNHFRQMINRYQELGFALGGSACVARLGGVEIDEAAEAAAQSSGSGKAAPNRKPLLILLAVSLVVMLVPAVVPLWIGLTLLVINACYGAGFSTIPAVLADHFGMSDISKIHGAVLSAWGFAGLVGNQVSLRVFGRWGLVGVIALLAAGYALNILNVLTLRRR